MTDAVSSELGKRKRPNSKEYGHLIGKKVSLTHKVTGKVEIGILTDDSSYSKNGWWEIYTYGCTVTLTKDYWHLEESTMTKEEMFDFILMNNVEISVDGGWYTKVDEEGNHGERFQNKYRVSINGSGICGFDLEGAIQYYCDNLEVK